jgi:peptide/nickel transport system substrate-binding protein
MKMLHKKKFHQFMVFALVFSLILVACQQTSPVEPDETETPLDPTETIMLPEDKPFVIGLDDTPLYGGTLVVPRWPDLVTCNVATTTDITTPGVLGNVFEALTRQNSKLEPQPELAETWEVSEDGMTITYYLRQDVKWHDGMPFTSADVKFTFENILSTLHPRGKGVFSYIESIETPDDYTVIFTLTEPRSGFMYQVNAPESPIMPKHIYENEDLVDGPHATCQELPVGTGPFIVTNYTIGESLTMERNDEWWGREGNYWGKGQPFLDKII